MTSPTSSPQSRLAADDDQAQEVTRRVVSSEEDRLVAVAERLDAAVGRRGENGRPGLQARYRLGISLPRTIR